MRVSHLIITQSPDIFCILSGFSIFTFGFLTFLALAGSSLASILVIGLAGKLQRHTIFGNASFCFLGFVLVCTLAVLFLFALLFSSSALAVFLSLRLVTLVRTDGPRTGISEWTKETKARLVQDGPATSLIQPDVATAKSDGDDDDSDSNVSVGSTVVVNGATDSGVSGNDSPVLVKEEPE